MKTTRRKPMVEDIHNILRKAASEERLDREEIRTLLRTRGKTEIEALFRTAREIRAKYFGNTIYLYGFLYISTYCRNNCTFCSFRKSNSEILRYRKELSEILEAARYLSDSGVHLLDLTMGEDSYFFHGQGTDYLVDVIRNIREETGLPVMVSPGSAPIEVLQACADAGADWYACYQETYNKRLFSELRVGQSYETRLHTKILAHNLGMLIEEGILSGIGETVDSIVDTIQAMMFLNADQVRAMRFVPGAGIPLPGAHGPTPSEPVIIAILRLLFPDRLIPASLDVEGIDGLRVRLMAGANVITSIVPAGLGLSGVAQSSMDIESGKRSAVQALEIAASCDLRPGTRKEYRAWIDNRKTKL